MHLLIAKNCGVLLTRDRLSIKLEYVDESHNQFSCCCGAKVSIALQTQHHAMICSHKPSLYFSSTVRKKEAQKMYNCKFVPNLHRRMPVAYDTRI
jgi:hypothetical protein